MNFTAPKVSTSLPEARFLSRLNNIQDKKYSSNGVMSENESPNFISTVITVQNSNEGLPSQLESWEANYFLDKLGGREKTENHKKLSKYLSSSKIMTMNIKHLSKKKKKESL